MLIYVSNMSSSVLYAAASFTGHLRTNVCTLAAKFKINALSLKEIVTYYPCVYS